MLDPPDPHDKQTAAPSLSACRRQSRRAGAFLWVHAPDIGHRPPVPPLPGTPCRSLVYSLRGGVTWPASG